MGTPNTEKFEEKKTSLDRKDGKYELPKIEENINCPVCGAKKAFGMTRTVYHLPDGDDILILLLECEKCDYKNRDVLSLYSSFKPGEYHLTIDDGNFDHKVFRGASGNLIIEEIGIEIERAEGARFEYTNIEGIMQRIEQQLEFFLDTTPHTTKEWEQANECKKRFNACLSGEMDFTVVLKDPEGGSYISPTDDEKLEFIPYKTKRREVKKNRKSSNNS